MDVGAFFIAHAESAVLMKPTVRPLHDPALHSQAAAVFRAAAGQMRRNTALAKGPSMRLGVIGPIGIRGVRTMARTARLTVDRGNGINQWNQLRDIVTVRAGDRRRQRDAVAVREDVVLRAGLAPIGRIRAGLVPPKTARTLELSMIARDQSIWSAWFNKSSSTRWITSHTPASFQSRSRRQQLIPQPQPISCGKSSQGMPVFKTKRMPVSARRLLMGMRPGYRNRRFGNPGINGSTTAHCSSVKRDRAIIRPPCQHPWARLRLAGPTILRQSHSPIFHFVRCL